MMVKLTCGGGNILKKKDTVSICKDQDKHTRVKKAMNRETGERLRARHIENIISKGVGTTPGGASHICKHKGFCQNKYRD